MIITLYHGTKSAAPIIKNGFDITKTIKERDIGFINLEGVFFSPNFKLAYSYARMVRNYEEYDFSFTPNVLKVDVELNDVFVSGANDIYELIEEVKLINKVKYKGVYYNFKTYENEFMFWNFSNMDIVDNIKVEFKNIEFLQKEITPVLQRISKRENRKPTYDEIQFLNQSDDRWNTFK